MDGVQVDRLGAGGFFGEVSLTAEMPRSADVVSLGATRGVRCDPQGSPLGRRRPDPAELFRLTRADFEAVAERFPALEDRLHEVGMARVRRACSPQCSPLHAVRRRSSVAVGGGRRSSLLAIAAAAAAAAACEGGGALRHLPAGADAPPCSGPASGSPASGAARQRRASGANGEEGDTEDVLASWRGPGPSGQRERRLSDGLLIDEQEEEEAAELQARLAALSYPLSPGPQDMEVDAEAGDVAGAP